MSSRALLKGVEARLRSADALADPSGKCVGVQPPPGRPPAFAGQFYYAVWLSGVSGADDNALSDDKVYGVVVTITARMGHAPKDRQGERMTLADQLLDEADRVATLLHQDDLHRIEANRLIPGAAEYEALHGGETSVNGFEEPLRFQSYSAPDERAADWVKSATGGDVWAVDVHFGGAKRVFPLG